jgi:RimJ/RimL family protein N-acetyltransferase
VLETTRLCLRPLEARDAEFILELLNDPAFIANIGDKGVRTTDGALSYVETNLAKLAENGFGLLAVDDREGQVMGICGLVRREGLEGPDLGYAFLPRFWGQGFAEEAARAILDSCDLDRVLAVTDPANSPSIRLLGKLGFAPDGQVSLDGARVSNRYVWHRGVEP